MSTSASLSRRLKTLESGLSIDDLGPAFLFFPTLQSYDDALAFAGLAEHPGPVFPIRVTGVAPPALVETPVLGEAKAAGLVNPMSGR